MIDGFNDIFEEYWFGEGKTMLDDGNIIGAILH
jgi:hypothetical protein